MASGVWLVKVQGGQKIALKAVSAPLAPKIGYSARCKSTTVKLNSGIHLDTVWKAIPVNNTSDVYELVPDQLFSCKSMSYKLGIKPASGSTSAACGRIVSLVQDVVKTSNQDKKTPTESSSAPKMLWKFTRVKAPASPAPKRPPPVKLEETIVATVAYITQQNGVTCSSLSTAELKLMTDILCAKQINYTVAQGWPKQQTSCNGTARCLFGNARQSGSARQSDNYFNSTSEHSTNLIMTYSTSQNETAENVATDLSQALVESQNFYGVNNNLPSGAQVNTSDSVVRCRYQVVAFWLLALHTTVLSSLTPLQEALVRPRALALLFPSKHCLNQRQVWLLSKLRKLPGLARGLQLLLGRKVTK